ncbi:galactose ABC transporter substrate-binding protein [Clostridium septicum]|uniref:D-galactose/methyl-galactoside binding periplasmic protein MglB n=1 Tax=Clostridium septicum TaxID=1504 RepID=A0A9N7JPN9_CLOSE|nr:galactose ABC transporter substrate-binding protein [Clostridium septicum]AYE35587.1 galactose ABC transporter substrate-binding protein [Clostridium septicum]MDU1313180.1 galactose ABC transporter substrate-binding protein [Clostridium septicum]QAS60973.1 galactose ABC transporter substrate-binding protein [Clostridium septicum]UEC19749.1 galactose ABC transporter substrate-binding protein [Clostridium septicum]USS02190.1 galactose ABC transporter substrate-binding protein [Clostridium sep
MKIIKKFIGFLPITLILTSLYSCNTNTKVIDKEIRIGVTLYKQDDTFISNIAKNIEELGKNKESSENSKITIDFEDAKGSPINQGNQVDKFINQGYDVICVNLVDRTAASTIIDKCKGANIPIIFFNRELVEEDMNRWDKIYYVGAKARQSGEMQGEIIVDEYNKNPLDVDKNGDGKIQYVILEGEPGHQDTTLRTEYCTKVIMENGIELEKLASDNANWQRGQGSTKMSQWINEFGNEIEVVFSNNDEMALGAIHALNSMNILTNKPLIVGIDGIKDALEAVKNGEMTGTIISDSLAQANAIFNIAYILSTGGDVNSIDGLDENRYIKTSHTKITIDNVDLYLEK